MELVKLVNRILDQLMEYVTMMLATMSARFCQSMDTVKPAPSTLNLPPMVRVVNRQDVYIINFLTLMDFATTALKVHLLLQMARAVFGKKFTTNFQSIMKKKII